MKNIIKICMVLLLMVALSSSALAAASVTYVGGAEDFIFLPGSEYSDSDMFENFKGVLPGDVLTQNITVKNNTSGKVRIYMRAEPVTELDRDFLSQLKLHVECKDSAILDAAASETAQLTNNTLLGTFKSKGSTQRTVTLAVPAELGNEYMGKVGTVPWTFLVEEIPEEDSPETGDWFRMEIWLSAAVLLAAAILFVLLRKRRAEN